MTQILQIRMLDGPFNEFRKRVETLDLDLASMSRQVLHLRRIVGWTQKEAADLGEISPSRFGQYERGELPPMEMTLSEANGLGVIIEGMFEAIGVEPASEPDAEPEQEELLLDNEPAAAATEVDEPDVAALSEWEHRLLSEGVEVVAAQMKAEALSSRVVLTGSLTPAVDDDATLLVMTDGDRLLITETSWGIVETSGLQDIDNKAAAGMTLEAWHIARGL